MEEKVIMAHGSGGRATGELISEIFAAAFDNEVLDRMEDSAVVPGSATIAMTTDSFVVKPVEFPGGDIGRLCVCGTVNDLLMRGAVPKYLTGGFILEEGADIAQLKRIVASMAETAKEAGVIIAAGDTKVIEGAGGIYINTAGVGFVPEGTEICASGLRPGDVLIVSGTMGDHHAAILSCRLEIENSIRSDCAPLGEIVKALTEGGVEVHTLRDITRGGLGTVMKELAEASQAGVEVKLSDIPVTPAVQDFCGLLGLDPLYMGNEGKLICAVSEKDAEKALALIRGAKYGAEACVIGRVTEEHPGEVFGITSIGGRRVIDILQGEGLPRIC